MADTTIIPNFAFAQWSNPSDPNPTLESPLGTGATELVFKVSSAPTDGNGNAITGNCLIAIRTAAGYAEGFYVGPGGISGTTVTATTRGLKLYGLDYTTGVAALRTSHLVGEDVFFDVSMLYEQMLKAWVQGGIASGGTGLILGTDAVGTITLYRSTGVGTNVGFVRWNQGNGEAQFSNDGTTWVNFADVSASDLVKVDAGDTTAGYLTDKIAVSSSGAVTVTKSIVNPGGNEQLNIAVDSTASDAVVDVPYNSWIEPFNAGEMVSASATIDGNGGYIEQTVISSFANAWAQQTIDSTNTNTLIVSTQLATNKVARFYRSSAGGGTGMVQIGVITPHNGTQWGTAVDIGEGDVGSTSISPGGWNSITGADNQFAIAYRRVSDNTARAKIITVSGTVPNTAGASVSFGSLNGSTQGLTSIALLGTNKILAVVRDTTLSSKGYASAATFSGVTLGAFGSAIEILTTNAGHTVAGLAAVTAYTDKAVIFLRDDTNGKGYGVLITASGTTLSKGTEVQMDANQTTYCSGYIYDLNNPASIRLLVTWIGGASGRPQFNVATVAGLTLTFGTPLEIAANTGTYPTVVAYQNLSNEACVVAYIDNTNLGKIVDVNISTNSVVSTNGISGYNVNYLSVVTGAWAVGRIVCLYLATSDSNKDKARVFQNWDNHKSVIGFITSAVPYNSFATVNVRSKGIITTDTYYGALTASSRYYIDQYGNVTTTALIDSDSATFKLGVAKNTTDLDININKYLNSGISNTQGGILVGGGATTLHYHAKYFSSGTSSGANGTITFAHGLGIVPRFVKLHMFFKVQGPNQQSPASSVGVYNGSTYSTIYQYNGPSAGYAVSYNNSTTEIGRAEMQGTGITSVTVTTFDSTNVVITNTVTTAAQSYAYMVEISA